MQLPKNTTVAVADGTKFHLFRNTGDEAHPKLTALPEPAIGGDNKGAGARLDLVGGHLELVMDDVVTPLLCLAD